MGFFKTIRNNQGFTLIELLLFMTLVSIIYAVYAAPKYVDLQQRALSVQRDAVAIVIRDGIHTYFSEAVLNNNGTFPPTLDDADTGACVWSNDTSKLCFSRILQVGVTRDWVKISDDVYEHQGTGSSFEYDAVMGTFECVSGC